eukprot:CAMPEP_0116115632 /NCGR_PEP_ID=MMETSP0329-20121206/609_1 /TAXON_ID=697910 /ORGANISM="Pseudo-nitzschia arenysensis, Strain B593" /LENGTH=48 /DNA_ID= /DNA_START= /DNA_END= /DNA_ORIENTATION=
MRIKDEDIDIDEGDVNSISSLLPHMKDVDLDIGKEGEGKRVVGIISGA